MELLDVAVIGGGCAGASAGMYAARFSLKTKVFAVMPGGLITSTHLVENYPGIKSITGPKMGMLFVEQAQEAGAEFAFEEVKSLEKVKLEEGEFAGKEVFKLTSSSGEHFAKTVILATGTEHRHLGVPGEEEYANKGVSYCALCDAAFYKEKVCAIVGGGDSAAIEANILAQHAAKVYVFVRKDFMRAEPVNLKRIEDDSKVEIKYLTEIESVEGNGDAVTHVVLKDGSKLDLDGVFMAIGHVPQTELAEQVGAELSHKFVKVNRESETNVPGFYAAGDVTDAKFKQAIIGAAEGVYAVVMAYQYMQENFK